MKATGLFLTIGAVAFSKSALASGKVYFSVVDPQTGGAVSGVEVQVENIRSGEKRSLFGGFFSPRPTNEVDLETLCVSPAEGDARLVVVPLGQSVTLQTAPAQGQVPTKEILIKVTATRLRVQPSNTAPATSRSKGEINKFVNTAGGNAQKLTQGQAGVTSDANGQQHVRGEHTDITYVVDGVPLPDTLSGRSGTILIPSTIENLDIITGGFAPEFGGQTAAVLNVATTPGSRQHRQDATLQYGTFRTANGDITATGPLGRRSSYVFDLNATRTDNLSEPAQPTVQTAHNSGSALSLFGKIRTSPSYRDTLTFTLSGNPAKSQNPNRAGLPASYSDVGQGYGLFGLRNANGERPDIGVENAGTLGSAPMLLPSQQTAGQDINVEDRNEYGILSWRRLLGGNAVWQTSLTMLHSGQDVTNNNPQVDGLNLPIDNSIEYNPNVHRNIHHTQLLSSVAVKRGSHSMKFGALYDKQSGNESYNISAASRLALDALYASAPTLAPAGAVQNDAAGKPVLDVNGNPVFVPTSAAIPTLNVERNGFYIAGYAQDTWQVSKRFAVNYGLRFDWYKQSQNLGQDTIDERLLSPRLNFSYGLDRKSALRWSYNKLFNTPPLAQGAIIGDAIRPEIVDQYDLSVEREVGPGQRVKLAYYAKQIKNQVDVGLLIPGSQIGLYSGINFDRAGVHGLEFSYEISASKGIGWDGFFNYTLSKAAPKGFTNTGEAADEFNDHDQRHTIGLGLAYTWKSGVSAAATFNFGSGLASSIVHGDKRTPRSQLDLRFNSGNKLFGGRGSVGLDIENVFDRRDVINFQSAFSGTRFQQGRKVLVSLNLAF